MRIQDLKDALHRFHAEEDGIEAVQAIVILAIGGIAMAVVKPAWNVISEWTTNVVEELLR